MASVADLVAKFRAELIAGDQRAIDAIVNAYGDAWVHVSEEAEAMSRQIAAARAAGEEFSPSWLYRQGRWNVLRTEIEAEIARVAQEASLVTQERQYRAIIAGTRDGTALVNAVTPPSFEASFVGLQRGVAEQIIGAMYQGSPLRSLFVDLPAQAVDAVATAIQTSIIAGHAPAEIARSIRSAVGGSSIRATTIARTEFQRAHREASRYVYENNSEVVTGWTWVCARQSRTCAMCWAMNGEKFDLSESMGSHPNCRCAMVPIVEDARPIPKGEDEFAKQSPEFQLAVLGPGKFDAYRSGKINLSDLVERGSHPDWGTVRRERSLTSALRKRSR